MKNQRAYTYSCYLEKIMKGNMMDSPVLLFSQEHLMTSSFVKIKHLIPLIQEVQLLTKNKISLQTLSKCKTDNIHKMELLKGIFLSILTGILIQVIKMMFL